MFGVFGLQWSDELDGDMLFCRARFCEVDLGHTASGDAFEKPVAPQVETAQHAKMLAQPCYRSGVRPLVLGLLLAFCFHFVRVAHAERVVVAHTVDASPSAVQGAKQELERKGHSLVFVRSLSGTHAASGERAVAVLGQHFASAKEHFVREQYSEAIAALTGEEERVLPRLLEEESGRAVLVQLNLWLGCLHLASNERAQAQDRFRLALALDAAARLDAAIWPPEFLSEFASVSKSEAPKGQALLRASQESHVTIDGKTMRLSGGEATWEVAAGLHYLYVHAPGSARVGVRFRVDAATVVTLAADSVSAPARELEYDLQRMQPAWLGESAVWRRALTKLAGATAMAVVGTTGTVYFGGEGERVDSLAKPWESRSTGVDSSGTRREAQPIYKRWWFWTGLAVVVGGSAALIASQRDGGNLLLGEFVR